MKQLIFLGLIFLSSSVLGQTNDCKSLDFLQLTDSTLQYQLFVKIDSILNIQYPNNDKENITVDLNKKWLDEFLNSINTDTLKIKNSFVLKVQFSNTIDHTKDTTCLDDITLEYIGNCNFKLSLTNYVLADPTWCSGNTVLYLIQIKNGHITKVGRNVAG